MIFMRGKQETETLGQVKIQKVSQATEKCMTQVFFHVRILSFSLTFAQRCSKQLKIAFLACTLSHIEVFLLGGLLADVIN